MVGIPLVELAVGPQGAIVILASRNPDTWHSQRTVRAQGRRLPIRNLGFAKKVQ